MPLERAHVLHIKPPACVVDKDCCPVDLGHAEANDILSSGRGCSCVAKAIGVPGRLRSGVGI